MFLFEWKKFSFRKFLEAFEVIGKNEVSQFISAYFEFWYFFKMIQWLHGQSSLKLHEVRTPLKITIGNQDKRIRLVSIQFSFFQEFSLFPGSFRKLKPRLNKVFNKAWIRGVSGLFLAFYLLLAYFRKNGRSRWDLSRLKELHN